MRSVPVAAAKFLGNTTAKYRWFALAYLFVCFFLIPLVLMGISFASIAACVTVVVLAILLAVGILTVNYLQVHHLSLLPTRLRSWDWLPTWMTSLEPFDRVVCGPAVRALALCPKCPKSKASKQLAITRTNSAEQTSHDLENAMTRL